MDPPKEFSNVFSVLTLFNISEKFRYIAWITCSLDNISLLKISQSECEDITSHKIYTV